MTNIRRGKWRHFEEELDKRIEFYQAQAKKETDEDFQAGIHMYIWGMKEARDLFYEIDFDLQEPHMLSKNKEART